MGVYVYDINGAMTHLDEPLDAPVSKAACQPFATRLNARLREEL